MALALIGVRLSWCLALLIQLNSKNVSNCGTYIASWHLICIELMRCPLFRTSALIVVIAHCVIISVFVVATLEKRTRRQAPGNAPETGTEATLTPWTNWDGSCNYAEGTWWHAYFWMGIRGYVSRVSNPETRDPPPQCFGNGGSFYFRGFNIQLLTYLLCRTEKKISVYSLRKG